MKVPYVHTNFDRIEDDNYQTVDPRCVQALVESINIWGIVVDCCSPNGSGIVNFLNEYKYVAQGLGDAFCDDLICEWVVSNPPYKRGLVDRIIWRQLQRIKDKEVKGVAMLLRNNFSFAKSRWDMFENNPSYFCEIKMLFRPWWAQSKDKQPIHNFVWHVWTQDGRIGDYPIIKHWREK